MPERWAPIEGYEDTYEVSTYGRVRLVRDNGPARKGHILRLHLCTRGGYPQIRLSKNGKRTFHRVHQLVAKAFIPNPDSKTTVNHKDGIKTNNHIENLEWMTLAENARHECYVLKKGACWHP